MKESEPPDSPGKQDDKTPLKNNPYKSLLSRDASDTVPAPGAFSPQPQPPPPPRAFSSLPQPAQPPRAFTPEPPAFVPPEAFIPNAPPRAFSSQLQPAQPPRAISPTIVVRKWVIILLITLFLLSGAVIIAFAIFR